MADPRTTPDDTASPLDTPSPLDTASTDEVIARVLDAEATALAAVRATGPAIGEAVDVVAGRLAAGGRLLMIAVGDVAGRVLELGTVGVVAEFGLDDAALRRGGPAELAGWRPTARDAVVVLAADSSAEITAALAAASRARAGSVLLGVANPADGAGAGTIDAVVAPDLPTEPVRGAARLGAATALKATLDAVLTTVAARLGRVHGDLPVDLVADDDNTRDRAVAMVVELTGADEATARAAAEAAGHDVRIAVLGLVGGLGPAEAAMLAAQHRTLRDALAALPELPPGTGTSPPGRLGP